MLDDGNNNVEDEENDTSDDELFDSVCAICDNGGDLLWYALIFFFLCFLIDHFLFLIFLHIFSHPACFLLHICMCYES